MSIVSKKPALARGTCTRKPIYIYTYTDLHTVSNAFNWPS